MPAKLSKLAKKYKQALDDAEAARQAAAAAREEWFAEADTARTALVAELAEFAVAAGLDTTAGRGRLVLGWGGRTLEFTNAESADTLDTDAGATIVLQPDGEWLVDGLAFIDRGLRRLLVDALGVPDPEGEFSASAAPKAAPAKAAPAKAAPAPAAPVAKPTRAAKTDAPQAPGVKPSKTSSPPKEFTPSEPQAPEAGSARTDGKGPSTGEVGHLGRSGTRGFKRTKDVSPGGLIKDLKGPGPV